MTKRHRVGRNRQRRLTPTTSTSPRECRRCGWRGPLAKTKVRYQPSDTLPIHTCPSCGSGNLAMVLP
jgi:predicted RNA-binding Zn-ribbon protein involved in translation (DUF1610 family)